MSKKVISMDEFLVNQAGDALDDLEKMVENAAMNNDIEFLKAVVAELEPLVKQIKENNETGEGTDEST